MLNVVIMAWIIGSITLLIVKGDQQTGLYRDTLQVLYKFSTLHGFDQKLTKQLKTQLKLSFSNRDIADEQVLRFHPAPLRRKILRRLYMPSILSTKLMKGTRQQFVDSFLSLCSVEIFSPGEELLHRGFISSDLYLLIDGTIEVSQSTDDGGLIEDEDLSTSRYSRIRHSLEETSDETGSSSGRTRTGNTNMKNGDFLNELGEIHCLLFDHMLFYDVAISANCL